MNVSESDIELLETYLDDELGAEEGDLLRRRLSLEPQLVVVMDQLRDEREMRHQVYASLESDSAMTATLRAVNREATREIASGRRIQIIRQISAAAACIVVGVMVGWMGRGSLFDGSPAQRVRPNSHVTPVGQEVGQGGYNVSITDDFGRVLAVQHFDTLNEARDFSNDLGRWQTKQRQIRNGNVKLVGDEF